MARRAFAATVLVVAAAAAGGCHRPKPAPAAAGHTVRDAMGRDVRLPPHVARIVSLAPSATETLYALGAGPMIVGLDRYSDYPPAAAAVEKVGTDLEPSLERVIALRPDIVFTATSANGRGTVDALEKVGIPVYVSGGERLDGILDDMTRMGEAIGRKAEGERLVAGLRARIAAVRARTSGAPRTKALVVVWTEPLIVAGGGSHVEDLLAAAGAENIAADSAQRYPTYNAERVVARAPEVVILGTHSNGAAAAMPPLFERLHGLPATQQGRIHRVDGDLLDRPGPRLVDGLELIAPLVHPEVFSTDGGAR